MKLATREKQQEPIHCAVCHGEPDEGLKLLVCTVCSAQHHLDCINAYAKCPTLGCGAEVLQRKPCWNCEGKGWVLVPDMCRAQVYDCNRCAGTGYQIDKDAKPPEPKPEPEPKVVSAYQQYPVFSPRDGDKCFHCGHTDEFHSKIDDRCPPGTTVDEENCVFNDRRSALYKRMCICGYHTIPEDQKQAAEFERMRHEIERLRDEQRAANAHLMRAILFAGSFVLSILMAYFCYVLNKHG